MYIHVYLKYITRTSDWLFLEIVVCDLMFFFATLSTSIRLALYVGDYFGK